MLIVLPILTPLLFRPAIAREFSASFKGTDIQELINTTSKSLNRMVTIDPSARGTITVHGYDMLNEEQYYQFFLSVLDVYGFAVINMDNGVLEVVRARDVRTSATLVASEAASGEDDEVVARVVPLTNVVAHDLAPPLRQLNDNVSAGSVAHYEPSSALLITGHAVVIKCLLTIVKRVDNVGDHSAVAVPPSWASVAEVVKLIIELNKDNSESVLPGSVVANMMADGRTNVVLVSGEPNSHQRTIAMIKQLDRQQAVQDNTKATYLKYAKVADLVEVLTGISSPLQNDKRSAKSATATDKNIIIKAHGQTDALIVIAAPDVMNDLGRVTTQLDIHHPQVLVEAIIAEVQDTDGLDFGVQWANRNAGMTQFTSSGLPISTIIAGANQYNRGGAVSSSLANALGPFNGITAGSYQGSWVILLTTLSSSTKNDTLTILSIVTLNNTQATFSVGQEIPVLTSLQTISDDNTFNAVERRTVGVGLKVKSQINEGDTVLLEIEQEVSSIVGSIFSISSDLGATFNTRTVNNAMLVGNGETVVVGELLDKNVTDTADEISLFGDIPVTGILFRLKSKKVSKHNPMLFIRPIIIRDRDEYHQASSDQYTTLDNVQARQRGKDSSEVAPSNDPLHICPKQETQTFRRVSAAIDAFSLGGRP